MAIRRVVVPVGLSVVAASLVALVGGVVTVRAVSREDVAVLAADEAMAAAVARGDRDAFRNALAEDALFLGGGGTKGRDEVVASWSVLLDPESGTSLRWLPTEARVAESGDLAYTVGEFTITRSGADGDTRSRGLYVTVWGRGDDGRWRVLVDAGSPPQPDPSS